MCVVVKRRKVVIRMIGFSEKMYGGDIKDWYPMEMYTDVSNPTRPLYQRGEGLPIPFPFVDWGKAWNIIRDPGLFKGPEVSEKEGKALVAEYKRQYKAYKDAGGSRSYNSWIKWKGLVKA